MHRRDLLKQLAAGLLALAPGLSRSAAAGSPLGAPEPFDETRLLARARALAARPYRPRSTQLPAPLDGGFCPRDGRGHSGIVDRPLGLEPHDGRVDGIVETHAAGRTA